MIVAMFALTAFVVFNETEVMGPSDPDERLPVTQDMALSVLKAYSTMPAENRSVWYSSQLEQWIVETARDGHQEQLAWRFDELFRYGDHRLWLQSDLATIPIVGPPHGVVANTATSTHQYQANWGVTLIQPGLSHYNPGNPVDLQVLPLLAADALGDPSGVPYTTKVTLTNEDQDTERISTYGRMRTPSASDTEEGLDLRLTDALGQNEVHSVAPEDPLELADGQNWTLHIELSPHADHRPGPWLDRTVIVQVQVPTGWAYDGHGDTDNWTLVEGSPFLRFQYTGTSHRFDQAPEPVRFDVALANPEVPDLWRHQVVRVGLTGTQHTWRHQFLEPAANTLAAPLGLYVSQPDPLPSGDHTKPLQVHVPNPHTDWREIERIEIDIPGHRHLFNRLKADWTPSDQNATYTTPNGTWTLHHNAASPDARFVWTGSLHVPAGKVATVELPLRVDRSEGGPFPRHLVPLLEALNADGTTAYQTGGHPLGPQGMQEYWIPGSIEPGDHRLRVPFAANDRIPPGTGHYTVAPLSMGFLDDLQAARYSMAFDVEPRVHRHGEPLEISLETGILFDTLRGTDGFNADTLEVDLRVSDLWGHFTNDPLVSQTWPLEIGAASPIVGLEWIHADGDTTEDLLVAYEDGNLIALDGNDLPNTAIWRKDVGGWITGGPVLLENEGETTIAVAYRKGTTNTLAEYAQTGGLIDSRRLSGEATHLVEVPCDTERRLAFFLKGNDQDLQRDTLLGRNGQAAPEYRVAVWDGTFVHGTPRVAADPHSLRTGSFGPYAECSLVAGYDTGLLQRHDTKTLTNQWEVDLDSTLRGLWIEDVRTLPIEDDSMPWWTGNRTDEVLVVTQDHGYEVWTGWLQEARPKIIQMEGIAPTDKLLGVSWVNGTTGYAASKHGMVWKTEDGGVTWPLFATAIVEAPRTLIDFAFGGNGDGLFVQDNGWFRDYIRSDWRNWKSSTAITLENYLGVGEMSGAPGVVWAEHDRQRTRLDQWDHDTAVPVFGPRSRDLPCECLTAIASEWAMIGRDAVSVSASSMTNWTKTIDSRSRALSPLDHALIVEDAALVLHSSDERVDLPMWEEQRSRFGAAKASRSPFGAVLFTDSEILFTESPGPVSLRGFHSAQNVSGGPGPMVVVEDASLTRLDRSTSHLFVVRPAADLADKTVTIALEDAPPGTWRVAHSSGTSAWVSTERTLTAPVGMHLFLELKPTSTTVLPFAAELRWDSGSEEVDASPDEGCSKCLLVIGSAASRGFGTGIWSAPTGPLPSVHLESIDAAPVLVRNETGVTTVVAGGRGETVFVDARTGLALDDVDLDHLAVDHNYQFVAIRGRPGMADSLWVESSSGAAAAPAHEGGIGFTGPIRAGDHNVRQLSTTTGDALCTSTWSDGAAVGRREAVDAGNGAGVFGTDRGHLRSVLEDCAVDWATEPVTTGTRVAWTYTPLARTYGPQIALATIRMEIEGQGTTELYLIGYSTSTASGSTTGPVYHMVGLSVWDNSGLY